MQNNSTDSSNPYKLSIPCEFINRNGEKYKGTIVDKGKDFFFFTYYLIAYKPIDTQSNQEQYVTYIEKVSKKYVKIILDA